MQTESGAKVHTFNSSTRRQRQVDLCEFGANLVHRVTSVWASEGYIETLFQTTTKPNKRNYAISPEVGSNYVIQKKQANEPRSLGLGSRLGNTVIYLKNPTLPQIPHTYPKSHPKTSLG